MAVKQTIIDNGEVLAKQVVIEAGVVANSDVLMGSALSQVNRTQEELSAVHKDEAQATATLSYAIGAAAFDQFKADPALDKVNASFQIGENEFNVQFSKTSQSRDPSTGNTLTNHMTSQMSYVAGAGRNLGQLKQVRQHFKALGNETFGDKK
jgi:hypothetical protein